MDLASPSESPRVTLDVLDRYLAGEATAAEVELVQMRFARHPGLEAMLHDPTTYLKLSADAVAGEEEPSWETMLARIAAAEGVGAPERTPAARDDRERVDTPRAGRNVNTQYAGNVRRQGRTWYTLAGVALAAVVLIVVTIAVGGRHRMFGVTPGTTLAPSEYATGNAQWANITLSDGSTVTLNVASHLEVPGDYNTGNHTLRLRGEALFTVAHHDGVPFTVIAGGTRTQVLGTSFAVRHYLADSTVTVAVRDGKVSVQSAVLTAGREVAVQSTGALLMSPVDPGVFSFAAGVLTLPHVPLAQAIPELDRWYDVDLRLGNPSLATQMIEGKFVAGSIKEIATLLQMTFDVRVVRDGRVLTLYPIR